MPIYISYFTLMQIAWAVSPKEKQRENGQRFREKGLRGAILDSTLPSLSVNRFVTGCC